MYTIDDQKEENLYEEEDYDNNWDNRKGLIFKIIIIILCVIVLIWLIKALKNNRSASDNGVVHAANTEKVRLAAEDYFFLKNNKKNTSYISLAGLKREGLINDVVDANDKVCSESATGVNLESEPDAYKMTVKLSCSTNDKDEVFYYHKNTLACLNCSGKTHMDGKTVVINDDTNEETPSETADEQEPTYSCISWTDWSKERVYDVTLTERTKTLVTGVKYGTKTVYGDWSEYTTTPIISNDGIEIETKTVTEETWGDYKTDTNVDTTNPKIKIISTEVVNGGGNSCSNGYILNNTCYSNEVTVGNLTYKEYNSGNYNIKKQYCEGVKTLKNSDGLYVITYLNCEYNKKIGTAGSGSRSYTLYTYQEYEVKDVTYYRYRTVSEVKEPDVYTDKKYEEKDLPEGYVKLDGSEETYYSYKLTDCVK